MAKLNDGVMDTIASIVGLRAISEAEMEQVDKEFHKGGSVNRGEATLTKFSTRNKLSGIVLCLSFVLCHIFDIPLREAENIAANDTLEEIISKIEALGNV